MFTSAAASSANCSQKNNTVGFMGVDGGDGKIYVAVSDHNGGCDTNSFRFKPDNADTDKILSVLLTAKVANMKVRIDVIDSTDQNSAYKVYLE
ncbi:MAG: hypothetical protein ABJH28_09255 [Paraglaciecola sp.]|uniref:hypothetical protein n=1 Tax=Paraglaciecola sp. TaxID=1920173 RepID=UPI003264057C